MRNLVCLFKDLQGVSGKRTKPQHTLPPKYEAQKNPQNTLCMCVTAKFLFVTIVGAPSSALCSSVVLGFRQHEHGGRVPKPSIRKSG